jgi:squalene-associated FAD-dependent desaturase
MTPLPSRADVVVIGSGFAGMSAAVRLAERGRRVVVVEEAPRLGGRATSFIDRESGERVDNGQHVLFGCYTATYDFLRRIGAERMAPLQRRLTLAMADATGKSATLECPNLPAPWHLVAGLMRWQALGLADRLSALRLGGWLRRVGARGAAKAAGAVAPDITVSDWLRMHRQSPALCDWLWHPLAVAALNQSPSEAAAGPFVRVLAELFASAPAASAIGLASVPLDDLFAAPSARFVEARGGAVAMRTRGRLIVDDGGRLVGVQAGDHVIQAPRVISAVPWHAFARLWDSAPPAMLSEIAERASAMRSSPIVTVNVWLDQSPTQTQGAMPAAFVGFVGGPMHWVFDKGLLFGEGARHLSIVASGADDLTRMDNAAITDLAIAQLRRALPRMADQRVRRTVVVREPRATFSLSPGAPPRPAVVTKMNGFFLAGDWIDTGLPGTIEGAVRSGHDAAAAALAGGA